MPKPSNTLSALMMVLTMALMAVGCASDSSVGTDAEPVTILDQWTGSDDAFTETDYGLFNSADELAASGSTQLTGLDIDWSDESLLVFSMGQRNTGGYWAQIEGVQQSGNTLFFQVTANRPADDAMTTQAITYPTAAVVIPKVRPTLLVPEVTSVSGQSPDSGM